MTTLVKSLQSLRETVVNWLKTVISDDDGTEQRPYTQRDGYFT